MPFRRSGPRLGMSAGAKVSPPSPDWAARAAVSRRRGGNSRQGDPNGVGARVFGANPAIASGGGHPLSPPPAGLAETFFFFSFVFSFLFPEVTYQLHHIVWTDGKEGPGQGFQPKPDDTMRCCDDAGFLISCTHVSRRLDPRDIYVRMMSRFGFFFFFAQLPRQRFGKGRRKKILAACDCGRSAPAQEFNARSFAPLLWRCGVDGRLAMSSSLH